MGDSMDDEILVARNPIRNVSTDEEDDGISSEEDYGSSGEEEQDSTDEEGIPEPPPKKRRGPAKIWIKMRDFESRQAALEFVKSEATWSIQQTKSVNDGVKVVYRCKKVKERGPQCPAELCLFHHGTGNTVTLYQTDADHVHESANLSSRGISLDIQQVMKELVMDGIRTPTSIIAALERRHLSAPTRTQITNFIQNLKRKDGAKARRMTTGEFKAWSSQRMQAPPPDQLDTPYVVNYTTIMNPDGKTASIRIFMTTHRLIDLATRTQALHADATHKLIAEKLPVMAVGTTDMDRHYHPFGLGVTNGETDEDYAFIFQAVVDGLRNLNGVQYSPDYLLADGAAAITNGFEQIFGGHFTRLMCWAHAERKMADRSAVILNLEHRQRIIDDIRELQLCESEDVFDAAYTLFVNKWTDKSAGVNPFLEYFKKYWIDRNMNWFEGAVPKIPSTTNALESSNLRIKLNGTFRRKHPLKEFLDLVFYDLLPTWSRMRAPDRPKAFVDVPSKPLSLNTLAFQWASQDKRWQTLRPLNPAAPTKYYLPAADRLVTTPPMMEEYRTTFASKRWVSFDHYATVRNRIWLVKMVADDWENATCSCRRFLKEYVCKHILGLAIKKRLYTAPPAAETVPIGQKRGRGRPRLARDALVVD